MGIQKTQVEEFCRLLGHDPAKVRRIIIDPQKVEVVEYVFHQGKIAVEDNRPVISSHFLKVTDG